MSIRFDCLRCGKKLKAHADQAGRRVMCSGCGEVQLVPQPQQPPPAPEAEEPPVSLARPRVPDDELDMTPMIDMTFLLLIFFMVTATFALQKSIEVPPPDPEEGVSQSPVESDVEEEDEVVVEIHADSKVWVYGDSLAPSRQELLLKLRNEREGADGAPRTRLRVEASEDARHEVVVMALDVGAEVGMESIQLATLEDDEGP